MKRIRNSALLVLAFLATGMCLADVPDLLGDWTGLGNGRYAEEDGSFTAMENEVINISIGEQTDRLFTGNMTYKDENGTEIVEGFAGAIGSDNKTLYIAEFNEGYDIGTIISDDEIELIYLQDGKMGSIEIDELHRI